MARTGMTALLEELRALTEAGTSDYTIGTTVHWSDNALQDMLDLYRMDYINYPLVSNPIVVSGGTLQYYDYRAPVGYIEASTGGTAIFYIQDATGATIGTSLWTMDYRRGQITFSTNTAGSSLYFTGRAFDINAAAASIWNRKASHYAPTSFNFSTDNHNISREQVYTHCIERAEFFQGISNSGMQAVDRYRSDM